MSSSPEPSPAPGGGADAKLLLRVQRPGEPVEEVFVQPGLRLGRAPDNNIVIEDERVARHHAEVVEERGQYGLRCMSGAWVEVEGQRQERVMLVPGVRFRLGPAEIECCAAEQAQPREPVRRWDRCPSCGREKGLAVKPEVQRCPGCGREVVVLEDTETARVVLPARQGEYVLERELGRGGMAWVWKARRGARAVAVKILMPRWAQEEGMRRRFAREWELLRRVRHPRVMPVLGHGEWRGLPCLVMPVQVRGSLQRVLERQRAPGQPPCTFDEASVWFADVLEGLEALHKAGLVHRDIKPSNILLDETGHALLADLGIAREVGAETEQTQATAPTGRLGTGTYLYMAPEQWENPAGVDRRADLYSVGATFYHLLTGRLAWGHYPLPSAVNETVPSWFDRILNRLLASRPEERYESVSAVRREWKRRLHLRGWGMMLRSVVQQPAYWGSSMCSVNNCPHCGQQVRIPEKTLGRLVRCPLCGESFRAGRNQILDTAYTFQGVEPHRGGIVLTLGILSLVVCGPLGLIAWYLGAQDLDKMRHGVMDNSGYGVTQAGYILGIIGTMFTVICCFFGILWAILS
jgi:DNA-directed RNA polymerase subunit RPC12/RpoP